MVKKLSEEPARLVKWRFKPDKNADMGEVKYWWSDGSKTQETAASYVDAIPLGHDPRHGSAKPGEKRALRGHPLVQDVEAFNEVTAVLLI